MGQTETARQKIDKQRENPINLAEGISRSAYFRANEETAGPISRKILGDEDLLDDEYLFIHKCILSLQVETFAVSGPEGVALDRLIELTEEDAKRIPLD